MQRQRGVGCVWLLSIELGCAAIVDFPDAPELVVEPESVETGPSARRPDSAPRLESLPGDSAAGTDGVGEVSPVVALAPAQQQTPAGTPGTETPGSSDAGAAPAPPPPPCELGDFSVPERLSGLGLNAQLWGPALSTTGRALYFAASVGTEQLFVATRVDVSSAQFSTAIPVIELASSAFDGTPFVSASGLHLYFYSTREGSMAGSRDLWLAERASLGGAFGPPTPLRDLNTASDDFLPRSSADELTITFTSRRPGGKGRMDIWRARRSSVSATFAEPENVAELNTDVDETAAWLSSDELTVFFASNRAGGQGSLDFWRAARTSPDEPFGVAEVLVVLNSPGEELDLAFSNTERELFFSSDRGGRHEVWRSVRACR